jgi:arylformamidase
MIYDISLPITDDLPVWPGDVPVAVRGTEPGALPRVSRVTLSCHAGTHVDAPAHFLAGGATMDQMPLEVLIGPAWVAHLPGPGPITAARLAAADIPDGPIRLLLRTDNSDPRATQRGFDRAYIAMTADAADWLLRRGLRLIGVDGPSVELFDAIGFPVHHALLGAGLVIVENLALAGVPAGAYRFICLPLRIAGVEGAPARAVLVREA